MKNSYRMIVVAAIAGTAEGFQIIRDPETIRRRSQTATESDNMEPDETAFLQGQCKKEALDQNDMVQQNKYHQCKMNKDAQKIPTLINHLHLPEAAAKIAKSIKSEDIPKFAKYYWGENVDNDDQAKKYDVFKKKILTGNRKRRCFLTSWKCLINNAWLRIVFQQGILSAS